MGSQDQYWASAAKCLWMLLTYFVGPLLFPRKAVTTDLKIRVAFVRVSLIPEIKEDTVGCSV